MHPSPIYHLQDMKQAERQSPGNMTPGRNLKAKKCWQFELYAEQTMGSLPLKLQPQPKGLSQRFMSSDSTYSTLTISPVCLLLTSTCVEPLREVAFIPSLPTWWLSFLYINLGSAFRL